MRISFVQFQIDFLDVTKYIYLCQQVIFGRICLDFGMQNTKESFTDVN